MNNSFFTDKYPLGIEIDISDSLHKIKDHTLVEMLENSCRKYKHLPAFSNANETLSYGDLDARSQQFAHYLTHCSGLSKGDRVAIQLPNIPLYPVVAFGILRAGMVIVNTNPNYTKREIEFQFNDCGAKALIILSNLLPNAKSIIENTEVERIIYIPGQETSETPNLDSRSRPTIVSFSEATDMGEKRQQKGKPPEVTVKANDIALIQYTGGTTGRSKGAVLSHFNLMSNNLQLQAMYRGELKRNGVETNFIPLPLYHIYAFSLGLIFSVDAGNHVVLVSNPSNIDSLITLFTQFQCTFFTGINTLFSALCRNKKFRTLSFESLSATFSGGMGLSLDVAADWEKVTGCQVTEGYGLTEASPTVLLNPMQKTILGTVGLPAPSTSVKLLSKSGEESPIGEPGELCVKGPQVMQGYWRQPEATAQTLDAEGWLRTGDMAVIEKSGYIKIVDRIKDIIITSGFNVSPSEVEDVVNSHPGVLESAALGRKDDKSGEVVEIFVVVKAQAPDCDHLSTENIVSHCRVNLTAYKVPKFVTFVDTLPKSAVGKILKRELRK